MASARVIPVLLLANQVLVKTEKFHDPVYVGDPLNTVRMFNDLEADEIILLDILKSRQSREPDFKLLENIASECLIPITYGGGISNLAQAKRVIDLGFERVSLNSGALVNPSLISELATHFGSQAVVLSIDVKSFGHGGKSCVSSASGQRLSPLTPKKWAKEAEMLGAGEILLTSIDREGTRRGFDSELTKEIADVLSIPLIANGGAGSVEDFAAVLNEGQASAVGASTMFLFQEKRGAVVVNYRRNS